MRKSTQAAIGFAVSGIFLWLAFRSIDLPALGTALRTIEPLYIVPFVAITMLQMWWRAVRWRLLLLDTRDCSARSLFGPMMVGFAFNSVFPARAGEFARPLALQKTEGVPFAAGFSTVVLERLLDAMTLLAVLAVVPLVLPFDPHAEQVWDARREVAGTALAGMLAGGLFAAGAVAAVLSFRVGDRRPGLARGAGVFAAACALAAMGVVLGPFIDRQGEYSFGRLYVLNAETFRELGRGLSRFVGVLLLGVVGMMLPPVQRIVLGVINRLPLVPAGARGTLAGAFERFASGFDALRSPGRLVLIVGHTLVVWLLGGWSFLVMARGVPGLEMTFAHAMAYLAITAIAISLPSAPGFWGLYEAGGIVAMLVLGLVPSTQEGRALALGYTIVCHFFQWHTIVWVWPTRRGFTFVGATWSRRGIRVDPEGARGSNPRAGRAVDRWAGAAAPRSGPSPGPCACRPAWGGPVVDTVGGTEKAR